MPMLTVGSLFSGIGGFDLGLEQAGMKVLWQCEIDKNCTKILSKKWPDLPRYEDVVKLDGKAIERVDLICGGFPCQDLSVAGKRAGLAGKRSGLFFEFLRIIAEIAPTWVLIENVPGLHSSADGRDLAIIQHELGKLGYWWARRVLDAQYFGVAQRRRRVFIVGNLRSRTAAAKVLFESESLFGDSPPSREKREDLAKCIATGTRGYRSDWETENFLTVAAPLEACTPSSRQLADGSDNLVIARESGQGYWMEDSVSGSLRAEGENRPSRPSTVICFHENKGGEINTEGAIARALKAEASHNYQAICCDGQIAGSLSAELGAKQQNFLAYGLDHELNGHHEVAGTLQAGSEKSGAQNAAVSKGMVVRRLTPIECERLQGFPDGWTASLSDTARYKALGNAVAVPVIRWIGQRIVRNHD